MPAGRMRAHAIQNQAAQRESPAVNGGIGMKTDPPLTRRGFSGQDRSRKVLPELVELTGIEPVTS